MFVEEKAMSDVTFYNPQLAVPRYRGILAVFMEFIDVTPLFYSGFIGTSSIGTLYTYI